MFVVFDAEESGCRGSQEFIASHLKPHLKATGGKIQGAFILDTILNYDSRPGSQHYSQVHLPPVLQILPSNSLDQKFENTRTQKNWFLYC